MLLQLPVPARTQLLLAPVGMVTLMPDVGNVPLAQLQVVAQSVLAFPFHVPFVPAITEPTVTATLPQFDQQRVVLSLALI